MYYPEGMKARVSPVQSIEPHRILAPTRDLNREPLGPQSGSTVQSSNHYTTAEDTQRLDSTDRSMNREGEEGQRWIDVVRADCNNMGITINSAARNSSDQDGWRKSN